MILLDTHAWIWWASQSPKLSAAAQQAIANETAVGVAAISCWEVAMLVESLRPSISDRERESRMRENRLSGLGGGRRSKPFSIHIGGTLRSHDLR